MKEINSREGNQKIGQLAKSNVEKTSVIYRPIGVIHSEHTVPEKTPIQPVYARGCKGEVKVYQEFEDGLSDLEGFSHLYLIYHFHRAETAQLLIKPFLQDLIRGIFSTRALVVPTPLG